VDDAANELLLSDAAVWEMALKAAAGKLTFPVPLRVWLVDQRATWHFDYVPIRQDQILRTLELERHHTDPIDRLMIAQALTDDLSIVTPDGFISKYPVRVVW
jgi:PIN domain nuclease of toxin-antitoxin system